MLRKLLAILMAATLLCLSVPAVAEEAESLLSRAMALANRMNTSTRNSAYMALLANDEDIIALARAWGQGHEDLPVMVVQTDEESELIKLLVRQSIGSMGTDVLAASSMMETVTIFVGDDVGDGAYVMLYESGTPIMVVWHGEDGAVRMRAMYLPFDDLAACENEDEVAAWFEANGMPLSLTAADPMPVLLGEPSEEDTLERALSVAVGMDAMVEGGYGAAMGASESMLALMNAWSAGDADAPVLAVMTDLSLGTPGVTFLNEVLLPDYEVDEPLLAKAVNAIPTILLGRYCGTEALAASSMIHGEILFADGGSPMTGLILLIYEDKTPIMVASYTREGAVNMRAYYLPIEGIADCRTVEEVNEFFEDVLLPMTWVPAE